MKVPKRGLLTVVLVLFMLLLGLAPTRSQVGGCYVYPAASEDLYCQPNTLDTEAAADCATHPGCSVNQHFLPGSDCSTIPECQEVVCSADCQPHALGLCQQLGGTAVPEDKYNFQCAPGCCKIADKFCAFNLNRFQCEDKAKKLGYPLPPSVSSQFVNPVGLTITECNQLLCQVQAVAGKLIITVKDESNNSLAGAMVILEGTSFQGPSNSQGKIEFGELSPSTYYLSASKEGYQSQSASVSLSPGQTTEYTITLITGGTFMVSGTVADLAGAALSEATVSWGGPLTGVTYTAEGGNYEIKNLKAGTYTFTVSKIGFLPSSQTITLEASATSTTLPFTLSPAAVQGVKGKTVIDANANGQADDEPTYGVKIYIDGIFRGYSQYPEGAFELSVAPGEHVLTAVYQQYQLAEKTFTVTSGPTDLGLLLLTAYVGECSEGQPHERKNVEQFYLQHVPGKKQVRLEWLKPCPEVISYIIKKSQGDLLLDSFPVSPVATSYLDEKVNWGTSYTYGITAFYPTRQSETPNTQSITLGDKACEGRYHDNLWETFCQVGSLAVRKTVFSCDNANKLVIAEDCTPRDAAGESHFCAPLTENTAHCQNAGLCEFFADPFGLYYSRKACYGAGNPEEAANFCYYDYTPTIVNKCASCTEINTCFDYQSQDACTINNCLGEPCRWVEGAANQEPIIDYGLLSLPGQVTPETGHGYCVPEKYDDDDQCARCSSHEPSLLFENYYCSAQVCTGLGQCFSNQDLSACASCGDHPSAQANCYTYNTEQECAGSGSVFQDSFGEMEFSDDRCNWQRCLWSGASGLFSPGSCVKDGDGDGQDDCLGFSSGELQDCRLDISPPHTTVVPEGTPIISLATPNVTFQGDDAIHTQPTQKNPLQAIHYCISSANAEATITCTAAEFKNSWAFYPGVQPKELATIDLLASPYLQKQINGETYRLQFFSTDKYHNQEALQEMFIFVDNVIPQFEINSKVSTKGDRTKLVAYLEGTNEPMTCSFTVTGVVPVREAQTILVGKEQMKKEATFEDLPGVMYDLQVSCLDRQGNKNEQLQRLVFDLEKRIEIIHPAPRSIVASPQLRFRAVTAAGASCGLYKTTTNEKVADFISDEEGKIQETALLPGFIEGKYEGEYKIVCQELLTDKQYEDFYSFRVDFTPPATQIVLQEGSRTERPQTFGWEEFFISQVGIKFECATDGFACDKTYYCLGAGCYYLNSSNYQEYTNAVTVSNSTPICYYSTDLGKNPVYSPFCGTVRIEGYSILLENPLLHYYLDEQWGISNIQNFDWRFRTRVPTEECRFDFTAGFSYEDVPGFKVLQPVDKNRYLFSAFPDDTGLAPYPEAGGVKVAYVQCRNLEGRLSPPQKMNLEYDPSPPVIIKAVAEPALLTEGTAVDLIVETDDKTICKYSTEGHDQYELMSYAFPGAEADLLGGDSAQPRRLDVLHHRNFPINTFTGLTKDFVLTTRCRNGAQDQSELGWFNFTVDYSQLGGILSIWPQGQYLAATNMTLKIETSKKALCEHQQENGQFARLEVTGEKFHTQSFPNLKEKYYQIPLRCSLGDHRLQGQSWFTVDLTPPNITKIDDGNFTCGASTLSIFVYTAEENISSYYYQLYDFGVPETLFVTAQNKTLSKNVPGLLVLNGTADFRFPLQIPAATLNESHRYKVRVQAQDAAGHWSMPAESDGVFITTQNYSGCQQLGSPQIEIMLNDSSSCASTTAKIHCRDQAGCTSIKFGQSTAAPSCQANQSYLGQAIIFRSSGWLCYFTQNYAGKNSSGLRQITFLDADGDGIGDRAGCDACPETSPGEVVDSAGCGEGEVPLFNRTIDLDQDGLPNYWEQIYNAVSCPLDYTRADSDQDGMADGQEDYDQDSFGNYDEYRGQQDPCRVDRQPPEINRSGTCPPYCPSPPLAEQKYLPWILLLLGLAMLLGGGGYLIYLYRFRREVEGRKRPLRPPTLMAKEEPISVAAPWKRRLLELKAGRRKKEKVLQRQQVFGEFAPGSSIRPGLELVKPKKILPGAKAAEKVPEKDIFSKLGAVAKGAAAGRTAKTVPFPPPSKETGDTFTKLKELAKKKKS